VEEQVSTRLETTCGPTAEVALQRLERYLLAERDALRGCRLGRLLKIPISRRACVESWPMASRVWNGARTVAP